MLTIELHPEVIKFLDGTGNVSISAEGIKTFIVNNQIYTETDIPGTYITQFLIPEGNDRD